MSFLTPFFLLLSLLAAPIILLYMLRLRRQEVLVSSTMLWQKLLRDREANAPWQKLRRNLLLFLQLLILTALVVALARPFLPVPSVVSGNVVVLLDSSASMQAADISPNRFEAAKAEVTRLINDLSGSSQMTIIKVGQKPEVLASATGDQTILKRAVSTVQSDSSPADWQAAFALATGAAQGFRDARIILVSDGGLPDDLPPLPAETTYIPIGESGENLAITALATGTTAVDRDTESGPQLFASVANEGLSDREALLSLNLDGLLFDSRRITVPAQNSTNVSWELPPGTAVVQASLSENEGDLLALDDTAWAVHEGGVSNRVLLITEGNLFLEQVYSVLPGVASFKANPGTDLADGEFDLYVFDGVPLPDPVPAADILIINPQPEEVAASSETSLLNVTGTFSNTVAVRLADSPLLQFVDWRNVHIRQARSISAPWAQPLVTADGGPLILIGERNGHRLAIFSFDLRDSDLPLQIAFPILMANITGWLNPGRAFDLPTSLLPGAPISIAPGASTTAVSIMKPDGTTWAVNVGEESLIFSETDQLGLYQVILRDEGGERAAGKFAVNLFSPSESDIQPTASIRIGQTTLETDEDGAVGQREFWPWLLGLAIIVLLVEWWVHHRGTQVPKVNFR